jgi:chorismate dehydratase
MPAVRISCVSYLNSLPFVYGLRHHAISSEIELTLDNPAECARKLTSNEVDIGLIPVAAMFNMENPYPVTKWCIGATGPVKSVTLLSNVPLEQIEKIYTDPESVTSNLLTKILASGFWKINPLFVPGKTLNEFNSADKCGEVVIGDRSLMLQDQFKYCYDLAGEWVKFTGLPFVFARWVANKKLDESFLLKLGEALSYGIVNMDQMINSLKDENLYQKGTENYLRHHLSYNFDEEKLKGLLLFRKYASLPDAEKIRALH